MGDFKALSEAVIKGDINTATAETRKSVDEGVKIQDIIDNGVVLYESSRRGVGTEG